MKTVLLFIVLACFQARAQDLVVVSKVTDDSIAIKWLANNFEQLESMTKGAIVYRVESDKPTNFESVDFSGAKSWSIAPTNERMKGLGTSDEDEKFKALLEPIINGSSNKEQQDFAMLTATIENMVNPRFQVCLGNMLVDKDFDKNKTYVYKIEVVDLAPSYIFVDAYQNTFYSEISEFELNLDRKRTVSVEWNSNAVEKESLGFFVEHSMDKKREGSFLNELAHIPFKSQFEKQDKKATIIDTPEQGHWHYYRVHGLDPFGHRSLLSEWKRIYVPLLINAHVQIDTIIAQNEVREIQVSAAAIENKINIDSWALLRSDQKDEGFQIIQTQKYTDSIAKFSVSGKLSGDHFYYKIQAINKDDTLSSLSYYFFTLDQVPPVPPTNLKGSIDSSGLVRIKWIASPDDDIRGYKVFKGNQKNEEFVERTTRLSDQLGFVDTLSLDNLTSEVYYYVQSVDLNYNVSAQSDTILLFKPDTIPPMAAAIKGLKIVDTSIVITWANSNSEDLLGTVLIRNNEKYIPLSFGQTSYTDFDVVPANSYSYALYTEDHFMNGSFSQEVSQYYETGYRKALKEFNAEVNREENHVSLSWSAPQDDVFSYQLFRAKQDGTLRLYKTFDPNQLEFIDKQLSIGNQYTYSIKYINQEGIHSLPANTQVIY